VTATGFRRIVLKLDGVVEASHMNHPDFRVNGRIFASLHGEPQVGMAVLTPGDQQRFIADAPDAFEPEAGAWGRMGCTRVHLAHADEEAVGEALTLAWQLALTKKPPRTRAAAISKTAKRKSPAAKAGRRRT
jgi:hypothetical protein